MTTSVRPGLVRTRIPARLDRLPWARWHWIVILGLGTVWILDGLEVAPPLSAEDAGGAQPPPPRARLRAAHA